MTLDGIDRRLCANRAVGRILVAIFARLSWPLAPQSPSPGARLFFLLQARLDELSQHLHLSRRSDTSGMDCIFEIAIHLEERIESCLILRTKLPVNRSNQNVLGRSRLKKQKHEPFGYFRRFVL